MGLIVWIGKQTEWIILSVTKESRLTVAILLILWVSAFASAFIDNVPLVTMMVRIATNLSKNNELDLPLQPLIWALVFGACMGGRYYCFYLFMIIDQQRRDTDDFVVINVQISFGGLASFTIKIRGHDCIIVYDIINFIFIFDN